MGVRLAERRDVKDLAFLLGELRGRPLTEAGAEDRLRFCENSPFDFLYVCEENGRVLGLCTFRIRENIEECSRFGGGPRARGSPGGQEKGNCHRHDGVHGGTGAGKGCLGLWLVSGFGRERVAHEFYRRCGFRETGYRFVKRWAAP